MCSQMYIRFSLNFTVFWKPIKLIIYFNTFDRTPQIQNFVNISRGQNKEVVHFGQVVKYFELTF